MIRIMPFSYYLDKEKELMELNARNIYIIPYEPKDTDIKIIDIEPTPVSPVREDMELLNLVDIEI